MLLYYSMENKSKTAGKKILVIGGPTGVGKSKIAFEAAKKLGGEIISADSMQFYREIEIGTDKAPLWMRKEIPHHLIDELSIKEDFNVYSFIEAAILHVNRLLSLNKVPVITGGSGLYLKGLIKGLFHLPEKDKEKRRDIRKSFAQKEAAELYLQLESIDPEAAENIHPNDRKRIERAMEVYLLTGRAISFWHKQKSEMSLEKIGLPVYFILTRNKEVMYNRINCRVDRMFEEGWIEEVKKLKECGLEKYLRYKAPIGYIDILDFLQGRCGEDELKAAVKKKTRTFARKQLAWFRREQGIWIEADDENKAVAAVTEGFRKFGG